MPAHGTSRLLPGLACAALSLVVAFAVHAAVPALPAMTVAVALGLLAANLPPTATVISGRARPGLDFAGKSLMRGGIVMLGLKVGIVDVLDLGWASLGLITAVVLAGFGGTYFISRLFRLAPQVSLLIATGFSICGASAIGAMADARRIRQADTVLPVALVTLCGTLAIGVLPLLIHPLGLDPHTFGAWTGASVHDVGQVVATAQTAGTAALAVAVVVKLTRVLLLAPMIAAASLEQRWVARREAKRAAAPGDSTVPTGPVKLPPLMPLFIVGFLAMVALRSSGILGEGWLEAGAALQDILLGAALFGLGSAVRIRTLLHTGGPALAAAMLSWLLLALLGLGAAIGISAQAA
ncbi:putative sulfate exporter family transporter [Pseudarthrobacter sp. J75]|uniref:YeiH family protein n=1 Tax=unclassified Pseudarthrobacter TaxID=2647000 RepID=UPI002E7FCF98|nr:MULTISPECIES: putative sulfate exporter family transporter [unclassified Pseudarthrobacter]MEE2523081.1 putative sulfate exporter family transporter [Pseudarthrobacter sp. J47]MEE2529764.1 putative sulfate exporter family transporter [Pseudarthrobacter sp. J75]MEE2569080.1 putative sulfate exporter family transporter [Pseudarthrobacter sp. J64]